MANEVLSKFGASTAFTITIASLAQGSAQQSDLITNIASSLGKPRAYVFYKIRVSTATANTSFSLYLLRGDAASPNITTDNAGATDAAITLVTARPFEIVTVSATANATYYGSVLVDDIGPRWGVALLNNTGAALHATGADSSIRYVYEYPEIQ